MILDAGGVSSFSGLQAALKAGERDRFLYYVFDLLHLDGRDLTGVPLDRAQGRIGTPASARRNRARSDTATHFEGSRPADAAVTPAGWGSKESSPSARTRPTAPAGRRRSSRPSARTPRNSWSAAIRALERSAAGGRCPGRGLLRSGPLHLCRPHRHRLHARPWRGICGSGCIRWRSTSRRSIKFPARKPAGAT